MEGNNYKKCMSKSVLDEIKEEIQNISKEEGLLENVSKFSDSDYKWSEVIAKVTNIGEKGIYISDENGQTRFVIAPDFIRQVNNFKENEELYFILLNINGDDCACVCMAREEYECIYSSCCEGMTPWGKAKLIRSAQNDPEGFALWKEMGKECRDCTDSIEFRNESVLLKRAEMIARRIPKEHDDWYSIIVNYWNRLKHARNYEKQEFKEILDIILRIIIMMLKEERETNNQLDSAIFSEMVEGINVYGQNDFYKKEEARQPNILLTRKAYKAFVQALDKYGVTYCEIQMGGASGNDYLFGDRMSYYCAGTGELVNKLIKQGTLSTCVLFKHIDLMGASSRTSNSVYGLKSLLEEHTFQDFYIRGLDIDVRNTVLICQVDKLEDCPAILKSAFDVVIDTNGD